MGMLRLAIACIALPCAFCGCGDRHEMRMDVLPSLHNLLLRLKAEGYRVDNLPATPDELGKMIQRQGAVLGTYAEGAFDDFLKNGNPQLIDKQQYEKWIKLSMSDAVYKEVVAVNGEFPGSYMVSGDGRLAVARLQFGNVVLMPQPMAGVGDNAFKIVHGTETAPPHTYIAAYLWARHGFGADAMIHFGTHGSLEFTPRKQVALSSDDWPDILVGTTPHIYIYTIGVTWARALSPNAVPTPLWCRTSPRLSPKATCAGSTASCRRL